MFPLVSLATIVPVLFLGLSGHSLAGRRCWSAGSSSASAAPPSRSASRSSTPGSRRERRGLAIGIFGMGMGGTAISALTTVKLVDGARHRDAVRDHRRSCWRPTRCWPCWCCATRRAGSSRPSRCPAAWPRRRGCGSPGRRAALYAVAFGGYVAFSVYLPAYLKTAYGLTQADAANRMAGFVAARRADAPGRRLAVRPVRADPRAGRRASRSSRWARSSRRSPPASPRWARSRSWPWPPRWAPAAARRSPWSRCWPRRTRSARSPAWSARPAASAGSCPPLVMGFVYGQYGSYAVGLAALAVVAAAALVLDRHGPCATRGRHAAADASVRQA